MIGKVDLTSHKVGTPSNDKKYAGTDGHVFLKFQKFQFWNELESLKKMKRNVFVNLIGTEGQTRFNFLAKSENKFDKFERGETDCCQIQAASGSVTTTRLDYCVLQW